MSEQIYSVLCPPNKRWWHTMALWIEIRHRAATLAHHLNDQR